GGAAGDLAGAMALRLIRETTPSWEEHLGCLQAWVHEHGAQVPFNQTVADGQGGTFGLGTWCSTQRTLRRRGLLAPERERALDQLPGWEWTVGSPHKWSEQFEALADWARRNGSAN